MWSKAKDWLVHGSIPSQKEDSKLETDLVGPGYHINTGGKLVIESKADMAKRKVDSPDDGDAFCLTFAQPVAPVMQQQYVAPQRAYSPYAWMA
jgi:hypothetical protein